MTTQAERLLTIEGSMAKIIEQLTEVNKEMKELKAQLDRHLHQADAHHPAMLTRRG